MYQAILIISNQPLWLWFLLSIILWVGFRRTKPTLSKVRTLLILPIVIFLVSLKRMVGLSISEFAFLGWASSVMTGTLLGWLFTRNKTVRADHDHGLIYLPGSWVTLISLVIIFFTRYYFSIIFSAEPELRSDSFYVTLSLSLMGLFLGSFTGRVTGHLYQYRKTSTTDLSKKSANL